ncbi:MAG: FecR family protein [Desulfobaccales bacterium]
MQKKVSSGLIAILLLALILPVSLHAAVVGRFTQVRGAVDLLKGGKIPGLPAKLRDGVEPGDIIRTKARAKAELTMMDDSILVLAPESRLAVADYSYNPATNERRAVVRLFRGLVHTVVNRIIQNEEPDFIMETHTAVIGVRGTDWYTLLAPSFTSIYLARGTLGVSSNLPTLPALLLLQSMQFTQVPMGKQPFLAKPMSMEMIGILERLMDTGLVAGGLLGPGGLPPVGGEYQLPLGLPTSPDQRLRQEFYTPPVLQPQPQVPGPPGSAPSGAPSTPTPLR